MKDLPMRVLIVGCGSMTSRLLEFALGEAGETVSVAADSATAVDAAIGNGADAVIVNMEFDGGHGSKFCTLLRSKGYIGPLLVWGERRREQVLKAYESGIDDFVIEPFDPREVIARLRAVSRRYEQFDAQRMGLLRVGSAELSVGKLTFKVSGKHDIPLSPVETRILEVLMHNRGIVLNPLTLARHVWGTDEHVATNRVQVYIMRLRRKIEPDPNSPRFIHTIRGLGYLFRDEEEQRRDSSSMRATDLD